LQVDEIRDVDRAEDIGIGCTLCKILRQALEHDLRCCPYYVDFDSVLRREYLAGRLGVARVDAGDVPGDLALLARRAFNRLDISKRRPCAPEQQCTTAGQDGAPAQYGNRVPDASRVHQDAVC